MHGAKQIELRRVDDPVTRINHEMIRNKRNVSTILRQSHFVFRLERLAGGLAD